ncbi:CPBP family intramembrane glutamic endopeptidase [Pseudaestuariivita rosea]|uniref:CPBP family intramembrane glutamic endopeptidase n=1 Tax=Pseudaestuariivita rosea TaxID=2763263 RepID=UPI001ABA87F8|nr:CPBP family intramembrane glutamic endopeptidase [Pseudaestuariivita rosea]
MPYAAHEQLVHPARATAGLHYLIAGIIFIELAFMLSAGSLAMMLDQTGTGIDGNGSVGLALLELFVFVFFGIAVVAVAELHHNRSFGSLIGPLAQVVYDLRQTLIWMFSILMIIEAVFVLSYTSDIVEMKNILAWLIILPFAMLGLLIQTGSEELFYRGYIQQQLAARFDSPLVWLIVPNCLFALAHMSGSASFTENAQIIIWTFFFGLAASDITARAGNLGPAIAMHLANNTVAILLYGEINGFGSALALILFEPFANGDGTGASGSSDPILTYNLIYQLGFVFVLWLTARNAIRR